MITCREKLELEHPECINEKWHGGCKDCPHQYGYKKVEECLCDSKTCTDELCRHCWDQPYEGELTPQEKRIKELKNRVFHLGLDITHYMKECGEYRNKFHAVRNHVSEIKGDYISMFCDESEIISAIDDIAASRNRWKTAFFVILGIAIGSLLSLLA